MGIPLRAARTTIRRHVMKILRLQVCFSVSTWPIFFRTENFPVIFLDLGAAFEKFPVVRVFRHWSAEPIAWEGVGPCHNAYTG